MNNNTILHSKSYEKDAFSFFWKNHTHSKFFLSSSAHHLTISKVMECVLNDDDTVTFLNKTTAGFDKKGKSDCYNQGPYIDILSCSFKPLSKNECTNVSPLSTEMETFTQQNLNKINYKVAGSLNLNLDPTKIGGKLNANLGQDKSINTTFKKAEFHQAVYTKGEKTTICFEMATCHQRGSGVKKYDVTKLSTIKRTKRFRIDTLREPPPCAMQSLGIDWKLTYLFPKDKVQEFEWTTEVRTVFASNDKGVHIEDCFRSTLNWLITVHKIVERFEVTINDDLQTLTVNNTFRETKRIFARGHGKITDSIRDVKTKDKLTATELLEHTNLIY